MAFKFYVRFTTSKPKEGEWNDAANLGPTLDGLSERLEEGFYKIGVKPKERGEATITWDPAPLDRRAVLDALETRLGERVVGNLYVVAKLDNPENRIKIRVVELKRAIFTDGSKPLVKHHKAIVRQGFKVVSWGRRACRNIGSTSTKSQHAAEPKPNAEDWHGTHSEMARLANWTVDHASEYRIAHLIFDGRIWTPSEGWHGYTGSCPHREHVHVDYLPQATRFC